MSFQSVGQVGSGETWGQLAQSFAADGIGLYGEQAELVVVEQLAFFPSCFSRTLICAFWSSRIRCRRWFGRHVSAVSGMWHCWTMKDLFAAVVAQWPVPASEFKS